MDAKRPRFSILTASQDLQSTVDKAYEIGAGGDRVPAELPTRETLLGK